MTPRRKVSKPNPLKEVQDLENTARNERQKAVLLREVSKLRRQELEAIVGTSRDVLANCKKLCGKKISPPPIKSKGAS